MKSEILCLQRRRFKMKNGKSVRIKFIIYKTMFHGQCINAIVGNTATTRFPMCLKTTHAFGNLEIGFTPNEESLYYGLDICCTYLIV